MASFEVNAIVPSTRDLFQAITTRRRNLALVAVVGAARAADDAARLDDLNVSALAFAEAGPALQHGARATKTVPSMLLACVADRDACLAARYWGADGVCIDASQPAEDWDRLAKHARTMRMLALALVTDAASAESAIKAGARALLLRAPADAVAALARDLPRTATLLADVTGVDAAALRSLVGVVDAAVVPESIHAGPDFAGLVGEVDP